MSVEKGACWQRPAMFSEAQTSGSIVQYDGEKCLLLMKASSVSPTRNALCNCHTVNISKLSLNKLSVFIFYTLNLIFLQQCVI